MSGTASQITIVSIVYSTFCSSTDQRKFQSSTSLAFVRGIQRASNMENVSIWWRHHGNNRQIADFTDWGRNKMAIILQMTFSNTFSSMKMFELCFRFHWHLFLGVHMEVSQYWFRWWLGTNQVPSNYLSQWWPSSMTNTCCLLSEAMISSGFNVWKTVSLQHLTRNFLKQKCKQHFFNATSKSLWQDDVQV